MLQGLSSHAAFRGIIPRVSRIAARTAVTTTSTGEAGTDSFRVVFKDGDKIISPWHEIPLKNGHLYNFINEITKYTSAKMEVSTKEAFNPIAQDIVKGKLRNYHGPILWNYGCIPQTWEDPTIEDPVMKCKGDNDPVDVVEIGSIKLAVGTITTVKILGAFAMIDDGELDWKMIAINSEDPLFPVLNDIEDVKKHCPATLSGIREWFRWYKTPDGRPQNTFGYDEKCLNRKMAEEVIHETHGHYMNLMNGKTDKGKLWLKNM